MAGIDAFGTVWKIDTADDASFSTIVGNVESIDLLDVSADDIEVTAHDSTSGWKEFVGGLKDGGSLSMDVNFDPALHADLLDEVGVTHTMKVVLPADADSAEVTFDAYINAISGTAPSDDKLSASFQVKVTGAPTIVIPT